MFIPAGIHRVPEYWIRPDRRWLCGYRDDAGLVSSITESGGSSCAHTRQALQYIGRGGRDETEILPGSDTHRQGEKGCQLRLRSGA